MKCKKCRNDTFYIVRNESCDSCEYNGFIDCQSGEDREYTFGKIPPLSDITRTMVADEGECYLDSAYGGGCYLFICCTCGAESNVPLLG